MSINKNKQLLIIKHRKPGGGVSVLESLRSSLKSLYSNKNLTLKLDSYRNLVFVHQELLNKNDTIFKILSPIKKNVYNYLSTDSILVQSFLYLRCVRPISKKISHDMDAIPFHRESFYGDNMSKVFNFWTPIFGKKTTSALSYVPNSHLINDKDIKLKSEVDTYTKKKSIGHKLGFLYQPKKIIGGINFKNLKKMKVPYGSSVIFDGNLIHGPTKNESDDFRISIDFKIIRKKDYKISNKIHITSSKNYFEDFF